MRGDGYDDRFLVGTVISPVDRLSFHDGRRVDSYRGGGIAYRGDIFPRGWFPDGDFEFLSIHWNGEESYLLVADTAVAVFDPFASDSPEFFRHRWGMDEYARGGCYRHNRGSLDVEVAIETSESVNKFVR